MSHECCNVFVYGTLLFDEVTTPLRIFSRDGRDGTEVPVARRPAILDGYDRFTVRLREHGNFPGIVRGSGTVEGHLLTAVTPESLARMDEFEGIADGYYARERVSVVADGESHDAFAYVCGEPLLQFLDGDWDIEVFRANDLDWYVRNVVRELTLNCWSVSARSVRESFKPSRLHQESSRRNASWIASTHSS